MAMDVFAEELLTFDRAAAALKLNPETLKRAVRRGELEHVLVGKSWKTTRKALQSWVESRTEKRGRKPAAVA